MKSRNCFSNNCVLCSLSIPTSFISWHSSAFSPSEITLPYPFRGSLFLQLRFCGHLWPNPGPFHELLAVILGKIMLLPTPQSPPLWKRRRHQERSLQIAVQNQDNFSRKAPGGVVTSLPFAFCLSVWLVAFTSGHLASSSWGAGSFGVNISNSRHRDHTYDPFDFWCQETGVYSSPRGQMALICIRVALEWFWRDRPSLKAAHTLNSKTFLKTAEEPSLWNYF